MYMLVLIIVALVLYFPAYWIIRAAVRDGILAADRRRSEAVEQPRDALNAEHGER